jgi:adenosine deaminase
LAASSISPFRQTTLDTLRPHVQVTSNEPDLVSFLAKLDWGVKVLASLEACRRVAYENVEDAARNGLHYVELRFSPRYMAMTHQLPVDGVVEAVIAGVKEGSRDFNVEARLIGILSRTFGEAACEEELAALLAHRDGITALDLAGMSSASRAICLWTTLAARAMRAGVLPCTRAKRPARKASGRRFASWAPSVSAMA